MASSPPTSSRPATAGLEQLTQQLFDQMLSRKLSQAMYKYTCPDCGAELVHRRYRSRDQPNMKTGLWKCARAGYSDCIFPALEVDVEKYWTVRTAEQAEVGYFEPLDTIALRRTGQTAPPPALLPRLQEREEDDDGGAPAVRNKVAEQKSPTVEQASAAEPDKVAEEDPNDDASSLSSNKPDGSSDGKEKVSDDSCSAHEQQAESRSAVDNEGFEAADGLKNELVDEPTSLPPEATPFQPFQSLDDDVKIEQDALGTSGDAEVDIDTYVESVLCSTQDDPADIESLREAFQLQQSESFVPWNEQIELDSVKLFSNVDFKPIETVISISGDVCDSSADNLASLRQALQRQFSNGILPWREEVDYDSLEQFCSYVEFKPVENVVSIGILSETDEASTSSTSLDDLASVPGSEETSVAVTKARVVQKRLRSREVAFTAEEEAKRERLDQSELLIKRFHLMDKDKSKAKSSAKKSPNKRRSQPVKNALQQKGGQPRTSHKNLVGGPELQRMFKEQQEEVEKAKQLTESNRRPLGTVPAALPASTALFCALTKREAGERVATPNRPTESSPPAVSKLETNQVYMRPSFRSRLIIGGTKPGYLADRPSPKGRRSPEETTAEQTPVASGSPGSAVGAKEPALRPTAAGPGQHEPNTLGDALNNLIQQKLLAVRQTLARKLPPPIATADQFGMALPPVQNSPPAIPFMQPAQVSMDFVPSLLEGHAMDVELGFASNLARPQLVCEATKMFGAADDSGETFVDDFFTV